VGPGSEALIAGSLEDAEAEALLEEIGDTENLSVSWKSVSRSDPAALESLDPFSYDSVIVTSMQTGDDEASDTDCITALLVLKRIRGSLGQRPDTTVVSEIRNPRNRRLANTAEIDDFVVSNEVTSMVMAQLAEETGLWSVYREIFDPAGCEIYLRPASWICPGRKTATFREVLLCGLARREIVMGCIPPDEGEAFGAGLNPDPETPVDLTDGCHIVTLAER
jgi:hypothetical protein